jgi:hypothetical protein
VIFQLCCFPGPLCSDYVSSLQASEKFPSVEKLLDRKYHPANWMMYYQLNIALYDNGGSDVFKLSGLDGCDLAIVMIEIASCSVHQAIKVSL